VTPFDNGSFRWVQCQLDHLQTLDRDSARRKALDDLPPGLYETYKRDLDRLSSTPDRLRITLGALKWLVFATESIVVEHLAASYNVG
jgi:hypothetical protein